IEAGASGVHFEDQLASEKKCGHLGGKVLLPTQVAIKNLVAARFAADVMGTPTVIMARTRSEEHTSELQSRFELVCRLRLEKNRQDTMLLVPCTDRLLHRRTAAVRREARPQRPPRRDIRQPFVLLRHRRPKWGTSTHQRGSQ